MAASEKDEKARPPASPALWVVLGVALTLVVVVVVRVTDTRETAPAPVVSTATVSTTMASAVPPPAAAASAKAAFADLYLEYLLKTYYVYERGFCKALLRAICQSLASTKLLGPGHCGRVPNAELVLAIGRFQHDLGLPVDGKAGPETVRRMLGGGFKSRKAMAEKFCPGWRPANTTPAPRSSAPDATVTW